MWETLCGHVSLFHDEHDEAEVPGTLEAATASWLLGLLTVQSGQRARVWVEIWMFAAHLSS